MNDNQLPVLNKLVSVLEQRKNASADTSYVASLYTNGLNKILEKVGEESTECILAAKDCEAAGTPSNQQAVIGETADLWFHSLVMLSQLELDFNDVLDELDRRFGLSGLEEKASRSKGK